MSIEYPRVGPRAALLAALLIAATGCPETSEDDDTTAADDDATSDDDTGDDDTADDDTGDDDTADDDTVVEEVDADQDGFSNLEGDCDDADPDSFPGMAEVCDGKDNDCDPLTDETVDADGDGASVCGDGVTGDCDDQEPLLNAADADGDGFSTCALDCDDADPAVTPDPSPMQVTSGFVKYCSPLFEPQGTWDADFLVQASVIFDGTALEYRMYYRGAYSASSNAVGMATSPDGREWTPYAENPVFDLTDKTWENNAISAPWVVFDPLDVENPYKMYYHAKEPDGSRSIGLATGDDGIHWTRYGTTPIVSHGASGEFDETNAHAPTVVPAGATWHMWYSGKTPGDVYSIGYATSADQGYTWTKYESNPIFSAAEPTETDPEPWDMGRITHPSILPRGSGYQFWYAGAPDTDYYALGYGVSPDLVSWERWPNNPVLGPGAEGRWDDAEIWAASVYDLGDRSLMFYSATSDIGGTYARIGLALNQKPAASVFAPDAGDVLAAESELLLAGMVADDFVETTSVTWESDQDGVLADLVPDAYGRVNTVLANGLTPGEHVITLRVIDDSGLERTAAVTVTQQ